MSRRYLRQNSARAIRAAARSAEMIHAEAVSFDWIAAAVGEPDAPKSKRFSMTAYTGSSMLVSHYDYPVVIDLAGLKAEAPIPILRDHEPSQVVGHADEVLVTASALKLSGVVSGAGPAAQEVVASAGAGFPWRASVGAWPDEREFVGEGVKTQVNGKTFTGPLYVARKATLREVSFVAVGADSRTSAKVAASAAQNKEHNVEFKQWVSEATASNVEDFRDDQVQALRAKYDAEVKAAAKKDGLPIEAAAKKIEAPTFDLQAVALECARQEAGIEAAAAKYADVPPAELAKFKQAALQGANEAKIKALEEKWPAARLEAEYVRAGALFERDLIRAERPKAPAIHGSSRDASPQAIEAAFAMSCGLREPEKHFKAEVLEAAAKQYRGIGLQELLLIHARDAGYAGRMSVNDGNLREVIRAAFSTHTLTTLLSTTGNKLLLEGFTSIPQSWREVAQVRPVNDFKQVTAFRLTAGLEYEEVGPAGEMKHGTLGQESYTMQARTYAKLLTLTRTDIVNDDLGALNDVRNRLGIGAAIKLNKVFWTAWLSASDGAAFWTAARGNLVTGSALAEAGLNTAVAAFRDMAGPDGNMMSLEPALLLVPSALEATARKLYTSQEVRDMTASAKFLVANIYQNRFRPVIVPELGNGAYTGFSATTWFLLANPAVLASALVCFLGGQEAPTIESAEADFDTLGIQFRGYHDFGASMSEYRASVKATV